MLARTFETRSVAALLVCAALTGCAAKDKTSDNPPAPLTGLLAVEDGPVAVLVYESGRSAADDAAPVAFAAALREHRGDQSQVKRTYEDAIDLAINLNQSANRAEAARLHLVDAPFLVTLAPGGLVMTRDEGTLTTETILERLNAASSKWTSYTERLRPFTLAVEARPNDAESRVQLADFLIEHQNAVDAIPHYKTVAHDESVDVALRIHAWTEMGRAHLWIGQPEKGRHSAQALIATLGPNHPDAVAGGNLVRGIQDTNAKRFGRAREELEAAVAAAPQSAYGKEAAERLAKLPAATTGPVTQPAGRP